jgi:PEP-CTERM motif
MNKLAIGTLCLVLSTVSRANTILSLTLDPDFPGDYAFYSYTSTGGQAESNIPVDPYIAYLTGGSYNNTAFWSFCFDFNSPTTVGQAYSGSFETFTDSSDLEATYLMNKLDTVGLANASLAVRGAISTAIWEIMNPSSATKLTPFPGDPAAQSYEAEAANAVAKGWWTSSDAALFPIWVPQNSTIQRFGLIPPNQTPVSLPEPGSPALVGLGVSGLVVMGWRRRRFR